MSAVTAAVWPSNEPPPLPIGHTLPLDIVLALPSGSAMRDVIQERRNDGDRPKQFAHVFARDGQYFAVIDFDGPGRPGLLLPLDVWVWAP